MTARRLATVLHQLNLALEESPAPAFEGPRLASMLGVEVLADLLGISPASLRRYVAGQRGIPDEVAERLHFLAMVVGDLAGAYNDIGIRRWFFCRRSQLGNRTPADLLKRDWSPDERGPQRVRDLSRSLFASTTT